MNDDLTQKIEKITKYLTDNGFNIFHASGFLDNSELSEITWDNNVSYDQFFTIAKKEGINTIIFDSDRLADSQIEEIDEMLKDEKDIPNIEEWKTMFQDRKEQERKTGAYNFAWVKDNIIYSLSEQTQWNKVLHQKLIELSTSEREQHMRIQKSSENRLQKELDKKSIEDIGEEFMEYLLKEFPDATTRDVYVTERAFWDKKGISIISGDDIILSEKVRKYADKKITDREKEKLPGLIEGCLAWAKENELKKVSKRNLDVFLDEQDIRIRWETRDKIYNKVNMRLKDR